MANRDINTTNNYYEKYVGCFAKRFYSKFEKNNIAKIIGFKLANDIAWFHMENDKKQQWWWDVEDCVIITNEQPEIEDERIANIYNPEYNGYNPYD